MISLIVVTWNGGRGFLADLAHLIESTREEVGELIVVDNGSDDGTPECIERDHPDVRLVRAGENRGYASGVNRGLERASGDVLVVLNPDAAPVAGALTELAAAVRANPCFLLLGGVVTDPASRVDPFAVRRRPRVGDILREGFFLRRPKRRDRERLLDAGAGVLEVDVVSGAALAGSRENLERLGPLNEEFFLYHEDVEWCDRAHALGGRVGVVPGAIIHHRQGTTTRRDERAPFSARMLSDFQYFVETRGVRPEAIRWRWRVRTLFRAILYGLDARFGLLGRRPGSLLRSRIYRGLFDSLRKFRWTARSDGQNAHPERVRRWVDRRVGDAAPGAAGSGRKDG